MRRTISSKPGKMRKRQFACSKHLKGRLLCARLSRELSAQYGTRSVRVRKGDRVRVMRGDFAGHEDEVTEVDLERGFAYIKDVTRDKTDGTKAFVPVRASNLQITKLALDDERRQKIMQRRGMP